MKLQALQGSQAPLWRVQVSSVSRARVGTQGGPKAGGDAQSHRLSACRQSTLLVCRGFTGMQIYFNKSYYLHVQVNYLSKQKHEYFWDSYFICAWKSMQG